MNTGISFQAKQITVSAATRQEADTNPFILDDVLRLLLPRRSIQYQSNSNKSIFKALNPSMSDLPEAESAVRVQLKPSEERNRRTSRKSRGWSGEGKEGNMGLYVHRNHLGLLGTGKLRGREFLYLTPTRCTVPTRMTLH